MGTAEPCKNVIEDVSISLKIPGGIYLDQFSALCFFFPKAKIGTRVMCNDGVREL